MIRAAFLALVLLLGLAASGSAADDHPPSAYGFQTNTASATDDAVPPSVNCHITNVRGSADSPVPNCYAHQTNASSGTTDDVPPSLYLHITNPGGTPDSTLPGFTVHVTNFASGYAGLFDEISGGFAEYSLDRSPSVDYAGALFQVSNGSSTVDAPQNTNHTVNLTPLAALGCSFNSTDGNGVQTSTNCTYSKIYDGSGNDNTLVPNAFGGTAAPYAIEAATGLPILETTGTQSYTLASDGNAVGFTGGTAALSVIYNGKQEATGYCCGPVGIGHNHTASDVFGTTFYISAAYGFNGNQSNNNCATPTTFCTGADEESINDFADYAYSNIGSIFAITNWGGSGANVVKNYINGGLVSTASPPAASLCSGCGGIDLPGSIHACAGGDLSGPAHCLVREFGFANGATAANNAAYANATSFFSGLTYTNYVPPTTAVSVVQSKASQTAGPGTSATATFSSSTGTTKHGVAVGLTWCSSTGCGTATGDVFASGAGGIAVAGGGTQHKSATSGGAGTVETATLPAGTTAGNLGIIAIGWCGNNSGNCNPAAVSDNAEDVAIGTSACTEVPGTYSGTANGGNHGASVIFVCPNLNASQSVCTATFPSTVYYETVACTEVSGALTVSPAEVGNNNAGTSGTPSITTNGNVSSSGEFIYSFINDLSGDTVTAGQTVINTNVASSKDEYQIGSSSGITYTNTWTGNSGSSKVQSIVGIIPTSSSPGTVTVGSNSCTEVPSSFFSGSGVSGTYYQGEIWNCPNLAAAGTLVTATTAGTSVEDLGITADELSCPTSGCTLDGTADGGTGLSPGTFWFCNATTSGNLAASGEFLYSVGMASVPLYAHGQGTGLSSFGSAAPYIADQGGPAGASGHAPTAQFLINAYTGGIGCAVAAIAP